VILDWFRGILKSENLTPEKYNGDWKRFITWWNDHDMGIRAWDNVLVANLTATGPLNAGGFKITNLANGTAATDAAAFGQIGTPITFTDWASYTPTIAGCGTVSGVSFRWMQTGNHIYVKGFFTTGTNTANAVTVTLPNSTVIASTKASANFLLGISERLAAGAASTIASWFVFYDGSDTSHAYITQQVASNAFVKNNGSDIFANNDSCTLFFDYPI